METGKLAPAISSGFHIMRLHHGHYFLRFTFSLLFAILSCPTLAQMSGGIGGMGGGKGHMHRDSERSVNAAIESPVQNAQQQRFSELEAKLKLSDKQWPLWESYQEKVSALNADLMRNPNGVLIAQDNAMQQIERKADVVRNRLTALEEISDAARALYQSFDAEQKKVADAALAATVPDVYSGFAQAKGKTERSSVKPPERGTAGPDGDGQPPSR